MPGIYVRKTNWIDWTQRKENPNLTVPGSYWLCHKNDIYKFIFRYHRTNRSVTEFRFGKELMKVIRRIIKNRPPQGQQFSTSHLLITFNLTWWNKQDKAFALLKFNDRSVNTFSHAFILTIKLNDPPDSERNLKSPPSDHSYNHADQNEESVYTNDDTNKLNAKPDVSFETPETTSENNVLLDNEINNDGLLVGGTDCLEDANIERESSPKRDNATNNEEKSSEHEAREDSNGIVVSNTSNTLNNIDDNNVDSANLPYQYLIEKEIETTEQNARKRKRVEEDETADTRNRTESDKQLHDPSHPKKKKCESDSIQRSSSDITDLVMEGLMFTIRQGLDTVAVIEQKTKLEMDEVLENSEKVETEEGEKRLRNSSLLGLENLITMIESPDRNKFENKCRSAIAQGSYSWRNQLLNNKINEYTADLKRMQHEISDDSALAGTSIDYTEHRECIKSTEEDKGECEEEERDEEEQTGIREEMKMEEDEDIIPEALQNENLQSYFLQQGEPVNSEDLFTGDTYKSMNEHLESVNTPNSLGNRESKINGPVIVSNQLITINDIPSSLREILKHKLITEDVPSDNQTEINEVDKIEIQKKRSCEGEDKTSMQWETDILNAPCTEQASVNNDNEKDCMNKPCAMLGPEATVFNTMEKNVKEESEEANRSECPYLSELKNITEDFHKNMEYLQKRRKASEKFLRPRRKSLYLQNNTSDCEMHVQMSKLFEDITRGAKVLVKRIDPTKCS